MHVKYKNKFETVCNHLRCGLHLLHYNDEHTDLYLFRERLHVYDKYTFRKQILLWLYGFQILLDGLRRLKGTEGGSSSRHTLRQLFSFFFIFRCFVRLCSTSSLPCDCLVSSSVFMLSAYMTFLDYTSSRLPDVTFVPR